MYLKTMGAQTMTRIPFLAAALAVISLTSQACAEDTSETEEAGSATGSATGGWARVGYGRLIVNDVIGDGKDRWRTGSVASSRIYMQGGEAAWTGQAPTQFGELLELRFLGQVITPEDLRSPAAGDRRQAGALSLGLHSHVQRQNWEISLGGDLVAIGPQTGLDGLQNWLHGIISAPRLSDEVRDTQIGNTWRPTVVAEIAQSIDLSEQASLRPFAELRAGDETLLRAGVDLMIGQTGTGELWVRDPVTGHRYRTMYINEGLGVVLGGDIAHVDSSAYLPEGEAAVLKSTRSRLRAGLHWQGESDAAFFGLTYLGEEFEGQDGGQLVGAVRWKWQF